MARIRSIKPEFWTSEQVVECSTNARLLFIGIWNFCDDTGRHKFSVKQLKMEVFPGDDISSENVLGLFHELWEHGLVEVYDYENQRYFHVTGWHHQRIDKVQKAKHPAPDDPHSKIVPRTLPPDRIGKDRRGEEGKKIITKESGNEEGLTRPDGLDLILTPQPPPIAIEFEDTFWPAYPLKKAKPKAEAAFRQARKKTTLEAIMAGLQAYIEKKPTDIAYAHASTWLNQERWTDEYDPSTDPRKASNGAHDPFLRALAESAQERPDDGRWETGTAIGSDDREGGGSEDPRLLGNPQGRPGAGGEPPQGGGG